MAIRPQGVDLSSHNPKIDWPKVQAEAGLDFVFVKRTQGAGRLAYSNPEYAKQWQGAKSAGLIRGAYHFMRWDVPPEPQAAWFLQKYAEFEKGDLPPTVDIENTSDGAGPMLDYSIDPAKPTPYGAAEAVRRVRVYVDAIAAAVGRKPIIYTYPSMWRDVLKNPKSFSDCPLWLASYRATPDMLSGWPAYTFWQYTAHGVVRGIDGEVDVNQFNGTLDQLRQFAGLTLPPAQGSTFFPETGQYLGGGFRDLWNKYETLQAGLALKTFGYPLSGEYRDVDGYVRQDFENLITEWKEGTEARICAGVRKLKYE